MGKAQYSTTTIGRRVEGKDKYERQAQIQLATPALHSDFEFRAISIPLATRLILQDEKQ